MAPGDSISGIGLNPMGNLGLGATGVYGSYDYCMPSMLGMNYGMGMDSSIFGMNGMYGMYGMNGMNYPAYLTQMQEARNQMELMQLQHNGNMHQAVLNNEIAAHNETDSALTQKILTNGDIQQGVQNLYTKVREGDQDAICKEFDKLKNYVLNTYSDEFNARGSKINPSTSATRYIEYVYSNVISAQTNEVHSLQDDIIKYGDNSFKNGFMQGFKKGHHKRYVDETLNYCFGLEIDQKEAKDGRQTVGKGLGKAAHVAKIGTYGAVGTLAATGLTLGGLKAVMPGKIKWLSCMKKASVPALLIGAAVAAVGDIIWQCSSNA